MGTKDNPGKFDCYANAEPDEPMFVLLARDPMAPQTLRHWAAARITTRKNNVDDDQITEAWDCADAMERWRKSHRSEGS